MKNQNYSIAIVVIAFNREQSLNILLNSLSLLSAEKKIDLIVSIDKSDNNLIYKIANDFIWRLGEKKIKLHKKNLGLKKHVLSCSDFLNEYDYLIVLEDDLIVSSHMLEYVFNAIEFYYDDPKIAGISLYNHKFNVVAHLPFTPISDGFDNYFLQFASSWGQVWSKNWWSGFKKWLEQNPKCNSNCPSQVLKWPESSWLKLHINYLIDNDLFFVYPRISLTSNSNSAGSNVNIHSTNYQVPILTGEKNWSFSKYMVSKSTYDSYFEPLSVLRNTNLRNKNFIINLYGEKKINPHQKQITIAKPNKKNVAISTLELKPHDLNLLLPIIKETSHNQYCICEVEGPINKPVFNVQLSEYYFPHLRIRTLISLIFNRFMRLM